MTAPSELHDLLVELCEAVEGKAMTLDAASDVLCEHNSLLTKENAAKMLKLRAKFWKMYSAAAQTTPATSQEATCPIPTTT